MTKLRVLFVVCFIVASSAAQTGADVDGPKQDTANPTVVHNSWHKGKPMPKALKDQATGVIGGSIYNVGGQTTTTVVGLNQIYDVATNTWSSGKPMPTPVTNAASAVVNNTLYVFGGTTNAEFSGATDEVWAYNPKTNAWVMKHTMPTTREGAVAVVENGIVYVIGGVDASETRLTTVDSYDPATDNWNSSLAPLVPGRSRPAAGLLGSTIVVASGYTSTGVTPDTDGYDVSKNSWSNLSNDPNTGWAACNGVVDGVLYVAGGAGNSEAAVKTADSFSLPKDEWNTKITSIPNAVEAPGSAVYNGLLYCFGGGSLNQVGFVGSVYNYLQIYQP
jgi:N-acetylneuraminic acid mutarotase